MEAGVEEPVRRSAAPVVGEVDGPTSVADSTRIWVEVDGRIWAVVSVPTLVVVETGRI